MARKKVFEQRTEILVAGCKGVHDGAAIFTDKKKYRDTKLNKSNESLDKTFSTKHFLYCLFIKGKLEPIPAYLRCMVGYTLDRATNHTWYLGQFRAVI